VTIVGVSFNSTGKNANWVENQSFAYEVWSDTNKTLATYYGSVKSKLALIPGRITVVLDAQGKLILEYREGTSAGGHPQEVLEDCQAIFGPN
jgi:peroxiredoxin